MTLILIYTLLEVVVILLTYYLLVCIYLIHQAGLNKVLKIAFPDTANKQAIDF